MAQTKCSKCGADIPEKSEFCPKCGEKINEPAGRTSVKSQPTISLRPRAKQEESPAETPNTQVGTPHEEPAPDPGRGSSPEEPVSAASSTSAEEEPVPEEETTDDKRGNKKRTWIVVVAIAVVILAMLYSLSNDEENMGTLGEYDIEQPAIEDTIVRIDDQELEEVEADTIASIEEPDYSIRADGVGIFLLGHPFSEYDTRAGKEIYYDNSDTCKMRSNFIVEVDNSFEMLSSIAYLRMMANDRVLLELCSGMSDTQISYDDCIVKEIAVYSPLFHTDNGIHPGMTAREIVQRYGATIELCEGEGGESIEMVSLGVPGYERMRFVVSLESLGDAVNYYYGSNSEGLNFWDNLRERTFRDGRLELISVGE